MKRFRWVFDTGGAGRGAWIGGVGHALTKWSRTTGVFPEVVMGSSVGGYMAADAATGDPQVFIKGWSDWGAEPTPPPSMPPEEQGFLNARHFRAYLKHSIDYVLDQTAVGRIMSPENPTRLIVCTTQINRRDGHSITRGDMRRVFLQSLTRKWPVKYVFDDYVYQPVLFDSQAQVSTPLIRQLTPENIREAIMASCLIPLAMGMPLRYDGMELIDGGFSLKMALQLPPDNPYGELAREIRAEKILAVSAESDGILWQTTMRFRRWNDCWDIRQAIEKGNLLVISPPEDTEAGTLCRDNRIIMKTFWQAVEHTEKVIRSEPGKRFFEL